MAWSLYWDCFFEWHIRLLNALFRRWMSDKKKIFIYFLNKKTNQNSLNFVSMRFFHHRVMFFSLLLRFWYFISFLSPILAIWISVLYSVEAIEIIKFHVRSGKFLCVSSSLHMHVYAMNLKRKSFDCFFLNFVTFSHSVSLLTLFSSLLEYHLCCRLGRTYNTHFG